MVSTNDGSNKLKNFQLAHYFPDNEKKYEKVITHINKILDILKVKYGKPNLVYKEPIDLAGLKDIEGLSLAMWKNEDIQVILNVRISDKYIEVNASIGSVSMHNISKKIYEKEIEEINVHYDNKIKETDDYYRAKRRNEANEGAKSF